MAKIEIVGYEDRYKGDFKRISYEWLDKYQLIDPQDIKILEKPKELILDKGGFIFFGKLGDKVVGTVALLKIDRDTFEVAKLGVIEKCQGLRIGDLLMTRCLDTAREQKAKKVILHTHSSLTAAISLYKKYGFIEVPASCSFFGCEITMELKLL